MVILPAFFTNGEWRMRKFLYIYATLVLSLILTEAGLGAELLRNGFDDELVVQGWKATPGAEISPYGRTGRALLIASAKTDQGTATWTSPVFALSGKQIRVSCWLAENYTALGGGGSDEEQLAAVSIHFFDKENKPLGDPLKILRTDYRLADVLNGAWIEPDGLRWCFRSTVIGGPVGATQARLAFYFPRNTTKGRVFLDDLLVEEENNTAVTAEQQPSKKAIWPDTMLLNTPAPQNIFLLSEPLRFDLAFWGAPGEKKMPKKAQLPAGAMIRWNVTDFLEERLAEGEAPVSGRKPFAAYNKGECEVLSITAGEELKKYLGTLLYFEAKLMDGDKVLATDTVSFMVTDPHPASTPQQMANTHFEGGSERLGITASVGADWNLSSWIDKETTPESIIKVAEPKTRRPLYMYLLYAQCSQTKVGNTKEKKYYCGIPQWMLVPWGADDKNAATPTTPNQLDWNAFGWFMTTLTKAYNKDYHLLAVDPAASERTYNELSHRMQMTGYKAIKAVDPAIPVGLSTFTMYNNDDLVEFYMKKGAFDFCDVIDDHIYCGSHTVRTMLPRIDRLYHRLEKMGKKRKFVTTEMAAVGTLDHEAKSADQIQMIVDLMSAHLTYFNCFYSGFWPSPITKASLRDWPRTGEQFEQFCFADPINGPKIYAGASQINNRRDMPLLRMTAMYNLQRFLGWCDYRESLASDEQNRLHLFDQDGHSILVGYRMPAHGEQMVLLKAPGAHKLTLVDNFGRETTVAINGDEGVVLTMHEVPAFWVFDTIVKGATIQPLTGTFAPVGAFTQGEAPIALNLATCPEGWQGAEASILIGKPYIAPKSLAVSTSKGTSLTMNWKLAVAAGSPLRVSPRLQIIKGGTTLALLDPVWAQEPPVKVLVDTDPVVPGRGPAVCITARNAGNTSWQGVVEITNPYFAATGKTPNNWQQSITVPAGQTEKVRLEIESAEPVKINQLYPVTVRVTPANAPARTWQQNLSFIACRKITQPITIDGSLADWDLSSLTPLEFPRLLCGGWEYKGKEDCSAKAYTRWDKDNLYLAYDVVDDIWHSSDSDTQIWKDTDLIMQSILPGTVEPGKARAFQPTRAHLGLNAKGEVVFDPADAGSTSLVKADDVQLAVIRKEGHVIYEMAIPFSKLGELRGAPGNKFRMSDWIFDHDGPNTNLRGLSMFSFVSHVDRNPDYWADWTMIE